MGLFNFLDKRIKLSDVKQAETIIGELKERISVKTLAFYIASSYIADTIGKCNFKRYVEGVETEDDLFYLLNYSPNVNQNATDFKRKLIYRLFNEGEALVFNDKGNIYIADSFLIEPHPLKGDVFYEITLKDETKTFTKKATDVFYLTLGEEKIKTLLAGILDDYTELLNYAFDIYGSANAEKYTLILDEIKVGDAQFNEEFEKVIKKQLESFINSRKAVYPQFKGQKLEQIGNSNSKTDSADIRDLKKEVFETTAEAFKLPVSMMYGNMTNVKDIILCFVTFAIDPMAKMIGEEITRKTASKYNILKGTKVVVDTTAIMHIDLFENADKIDKLIASSIYCADELRVKLGDSKLNSDFSKQHWITKNYSKVEDALTGEDVASKGGE